MQSKSDILLTSLTAFYADPSHGEIFINLVDDKTRHPEPKTSLRMIDWFVTDYAKRMNVKYTTPTGRRFLVHVGYKSGLKGFHKKYFDPFCRSGRVKITMCGREVDTTIAQMNFIRWCIQNEVLSYISDNLEDLRATMKTKPVPPDKIPT